LITETIHQENLGLEDVEAELGLLRKRLDYLWKWNVR